MTMIVTVDVSDAPVNARASACHICGSTQIAYYATVSDNGLLRRADVRLPVYRCAACDVFFLNPPPPPEVGQQYFAQAYAKADNPSLYYDDAFKTRTAELRLEMLRAYGVAGGRLLDVGCGKGQFVDVARSRGWDAWGVELDEGACAYAKQRRGLDTVVCGSVDSAALPADFDVVTLWDVIEHVPDPVQVLRDAAGRLRPDGLAVVRTGNIRSWSFDRNRSGWWAFGSDHRFYFSPASLSEALHRAGFDVLAVLDREPVERPAKRRSRDITETSLAEGVRAVGRSPRKLAKSGRYAGQWLRRITGQARYGAHYRTSIMTIVARKRRA